MALDLEEQEQVAELKAWWNQYGSLITAAGIFLGIPGRTAPGQFRSSGTVPLIGDKTWR